MRARSAEQGGGIVADNQVDVVAVCGSFRKASYNAALARSLPGLASAGLNVKPSPPIDKFPLYNADIQNASGFPAEVTAFADAIRAADGVIIVSPEYNWSRMKDDPFKGKAVALQSCAGGLLGGARMQYHLRQSLTSVESVIMIRPEVFVTFAAKKFDEKTLELIDQPTKDMVKLQLENFEKFVRRLTGKK